MVLDAGSEVKGGFVVAKEREVTFVGGGPLDGRTMSIDARCTSYAPTIGPHSREHGTYFPEKGKPGVWRWRREGTRESGTII